MAPFLLWLASATTRRFRSRSRPTLQAAGLVGLALLALSSCSRATYVFSPSPRAYLDTERPAPSVEVPAIPKATAPADSLPTTTSYRPHLPAPHRQRTIKPRLLMAMHARDGPAAWARPLVTRFAIKRLPKPATAPRRQHSVARYGSGPSGTLVVALCLIGAGLVALLVAAGFSANIVGALFAVFFAVLGAVGLAVGFILLLIALITKE